MTKESRATEPANGYGGWTQTLGALRGGARVRFRLSVCELVIVRSCVGNPGNPVSHAPASTVFGFLLSVLLSDRVCV